MSELAGIIFDALDAQHDQAWHVHAAECCWPFPGISPTIREVVADVISQARREGAAEAWDEGFERGAQEQGNSQWLALVGNPYRDATCLHCGHVGPPEDDHSCPCPYSDADCPDHTTAALQGDA